MENPNPPLLPTPNVKFEIRVAFNPATGQVTMSGPMEMKAFCIKALTTAIQIVVDYDPILIAKGNGGGNGN